MENKITPKKEIDAKLTPKSVSQVTFETTPEDFKSTPEISGAAPEISGATPEISGPTPKISGLGFCYKARLP